MSAVFWNTTNETGADLAHAISAAKCQDDAILAIYAAAGEPLSPSQVWHRCWKAGRSWPLTSIRRSITNLTNRELLAQTTAKIVGHYGRRENQWRAVS